MSHKSSHNSIWFLGLGLAISAPTTSASIPDAADLNVSTKHKSLLFDQSFDEAPVRPFLAEEIISKYVETVFAKNKDSSAAKNSPKALETVVAPKQVLLADTNKTPSVKVESLNIDQVETKEILSSLVSSNVSSPTPQTPAANEVKVEKEEKPKAVTPPAADLNIKKPETLATEKPSVLVLDETAFLEGNFKRVAEAKVHWLHPQSGLSTTPNKKGVAALPYPRSHSSRFVVTAPGYLPAIGYVTRGVLNPVLLYKESRVGPILKTLNRSPQKGESLLLGKFLDRKLAPISKMSFDEFAQETRNSFYSMGAIGLFHIAARESGPMGDFLLQRLGPSLQYLLSKQSLNNVDFFEWPAQLLDLKGLSPILTTTLLEPVEKSMSTQILDAFHLSRPSAGVYATIGGQRGLIEPDAAGILDLHDMSERPNVDLIEIHAQGYLKTWLNTPAVSESLPDVVTLFTSSQLNDVLKGVGEHSNHDRAYVVGSVRSADYKDNLHVQIYNAEGKIERQAQVYYFGDNNRLDRANTELSLNNPRFVVTGLPEGEFHMVLSDVSSGHGQSIQVLRTQRGTITQIQF